MCIFISELIGCNNLFVYFFFSFLFYTQQTITKTLIYRLQWQCVYINIQKRYISMLAAQHTCGNVCFRGLGRLSCFMLCERFRWTDTACRSTHWDYNYSYGYVIHIVNFFMINREILYQCLLFFYSYFLNFQSTLWAIVNVVRVPCAGKFHKHDSDPFLRCLLWRSSICDHCATTLAPADHAIHHDIFIFIQTNETQSKRKLSQNGSTNIWKR